MPGNRKSPEARRRHASLKPLASVKRYLFDLLMERERGRCLWCRRRVDRTTPPLGTPYPPDMATLDRIIPGAQGGIYLPCNVVLSCNACNCDRGHTPAVKYARRRGVVLPAEVVAMLEARAATEPKPTISPTEGIPTCS